MKEVKFMKAYRSVFQFGTFYRLRSPFETSETIWMVVSKQKDIAIVGYYRPLQQVNAKYNRVKLLGLDTNKKYHVAIHDIDCYGDELMNVGLLLTDNASGESKDHVGDYISRLYILKAN